MPCDYTHTSKAWMTGSLFTSLLIKMNLQMKSKKKKAILLVDGAGLFQFVLCFVIIIAVMDLLCVPANLSRFSQN